MAVTQWRGGIHKMTAFHEARRAVLSTAPFPYRPYLLRHNINI